jgi:hypothetical protein
MKNVILSIVLILSLCGFVFAGDINSPIAHWTFDEGSGTVAHDSADSHNGTVVGATWTTGKVGGCLSFNGSSNYVNLGNVNAFNFGSNNFTVSFWFKTEGTHDNGGGLGDVIGKYNMDIGRQWMFQQDSSGKINFATYYANSMYGGEGLTSTQGYQGQWVYCTGVRDGSNKYLYINGVLDNTGTCSGLVSSSSEVHIGDLCYDYSPSVEYQFFNGKIDDVRVYDYALSANEVAQLYNVPEPATICLFALAGLMLRRKK